MIFESLLQYSSTVYTPPLPLQRFLCRMDEGAKMECVDTASRVQNVRVLCVVCALF